MLYPLALFFFIFVAGGYSSGPASSNEFALTGAPSAGGGVEGTCSNCHNSGAYGTPRLAAYFTDMPDNAYRPGQTYTVTVSVQATEGAPAGYGFQAQFLDSSDPILLPAGTLSEPDEATQIATVSDRQYAEHRGVNTDSLFSFIWTAPAAGTGPVTMYLVGNVVDGMDGNIGDNGSREPLTITLAEDTSTSLSSMVTSQAAVARPNPTRSLTQVDWSVSHAGQYRFDLFGGAGQLLRSTSSVLVPGLHTSDVDLSPYPPGVYHMRITGPATAATVRLQRN